MSLDPQARTSIVILGGGTAGWIAANAMVASWVDKGVDVTLVESPEIGTVGVGEGSTQRRGRARPPCSILFVSEVL